MVKQKLALAVLGVGFCVLSLTKDYLVSGVNGIGSHQISFALYSLIWVGASQRSPYPDIKDNVTKIWIPLVFGSVMFFIALRLYSIFPDLTYAPNFSHSHLGVVLSCIIGLFSLVRYSRFVSSCCAGLLCLASLAWSTSVIGHSYRNLTPHKIFEKEMAIWCNGEQLASTSTQHFNLAWRTCRD